MEVKAHTRHLHMSSRKVRLVIDLIRGKNVQTAQAQLQFVKKAAALPVLKLLNSAIANAVHNNQLDPKTLFVKAITADEGPIMHRWTPRAMGRATPIRKRTTHISITVAERAARKVKTIASAEEKSKKTKKLKKDKTVQATS